MPLWQVMLLENLEVGALLGEHRERVAVKTHSHLAPAVATAGNKCAFLHRVECVQPLFYANAGRFLHEFGMLLLRWY